MQSSYYMYLGNYIRVDECGISIYKMNPENSDEHEYAEVASYDSVQEHINTYLKLGEDSIVYQVCQCEVEVFYHTLADKYFVPKRVGLNAIVGLLIDTKSTEEPTQIALPLEAILTPTAIHRQMLEKDGEFYAWVYAIEGKDFLDREW